MRTLRSELLYLQYLLNTKELSMEGIALFLRHNGYRVRHIPTEKNELHNMPDGDDRNGEKDKL